MEQVYTVQKVSERTLEYLKQIRKELTDTTAGFAVLAAVEYVFP